MDQEDRRRASIDLLRNCGDCVGVLRETALCGSFPEIEAALDWVEREGLMTAGLLESMVASKKLEEEVGALSRWVDWFVVMRQDNPIRLNA